MFPAVVVPDIFWNPGVKVNEQVVDAGFSTSRCCQNYQYRSMDSDSVFVDAVKVVTSRVLCRKETIKSGGLVQKSHQGFCHLASPCELKPINWGP